MSQLSLNNADIKSILKVWGAGSREKIGTEFHSRTVGSSGAERVSKYCVYSLSDDDYSKVDKVICSLIREDFQLYAILFYRYCYVWNTYVEKQAMRILGVSRTILYAKLKNAEYFVLSGVRGNK